MLIPQDEDVITLVLCFRYALLFKGIHQLNTSQEGFRYSTKIFIICLCGTRNTLFYNQNFRQRKRWKTKLLKIKLAETTHGGSVDNILQYSFQSELHYCWNITALRLAELSLYIHMYVKVKQLCRWTHSLLSQTGHWNVWSCLLISYFIQKILDLYLYWLQTMG